VKGVARGMLLLGLYGVWVGFEKDVIVEEQHKS